MHDEGSPFYVEMVDQVGCVYLCGCESILSAFRAQTTRGHQFLKREFGDHAVPRGTWQIDPFGHSNTQAWLLSADAGMESLYFGRMDYQVVALFECLGEISFIWRAVW